jgi:sec-independent protein translocase protein TatC
LASRPITRQSTQKAIDAAGRGVAEGRGRGGSFMEAMVSAIRTIRHEDRLSLVDHLDELRTRLIVSGAVLAVAFGFCLWQNHALLEIVNEPLTTQTKKQVAKGQGTVGGAVLAQQGVLKVAGDTQAALGVLAKPGSGLSSQARAQIPPLIASLKSDVAKIPRNAQGDKPVTLGVGEPFTTTITVTLYFALIISLPVILLELYGFILPALNPRERRMAVPLLTAVPFLFVTGVLFGYFVVLPAAVRFFVNFNSGEFNVLVQASQFYGFAATVLLAMGLIFQIPVLILGATRLGIVTPQQLRKHRRYAVVVCAAIAAFLPGDVITLLLETVPLYLLFEASILVASFVGRADVGLRDEGSTSTHGTRHPADDPAPPPDDAVEPTVQDIIDHVDPRLSD